MNASSNSKIPGKDKKICFAIPYFLFQRIGGAELQIYMIAEELVRRGWKVEILISRFRGHNEMHHSRFYNKDIHYVFYRKAFFRSFEFINVFIALLKTRSIYYYQRTDFPITASVAFFCKLFRKKMIFAISSEKDIDKRKYLNSFEQTRYKSKIKGIIRKIDYTIIDRLVVFGKKNANIIIAQTNQQQKLLNEVFHLPSSLIRNSNNLNVLSDFAEKGNYIIWVGNFKKVKRPDIFFKIIEETELKDWQFIMIGDLNHPEGITDYAHEVKRIKKENFRYLGELSFHDTIEWFMRAKILINTSEAEGFSNTFIQAWIFKCLVISLGVDPDNLIEEENLGAVCDYDIEYLKNILQKICADYDKYKPTLERAYEFASSEFDLSKNVDYLEDVFKELKS